MNYVIVKNGIIENVIVADPFFAKEYGCKEYYYGAAIGEPYNPPEKDYATYTGSGLDNPIVVCYNQNDNPPKSIHITDLNEIDIIIPYGVKEKNNIKITWDNNYVILESKDINIKDVKYYVTIL